MNRDQVVQVMIDKVEKIIKTCNAENKGVDSKTPKKLIVNEILVALDKVVKDED